MAKSRKSRSKRQSQRLISTSTGRPKQILLDEQFLLCASGYGCDSKDDICQDEVIEDREFNAIEALLAAYRAKIALVIDEPEQGQSSQVRDFYNRYLRNRYKDNRRGQIPIAAKVLGKWLSGRNGRIAQRKPIDLNRVDPKAIELCNLKIGTLDPLLCRLAIACHGDAPIWTLDSDFWCASKYHSEIRPTCLAEALTSVR